MARPEIAGAAELVDAFFQAVERVVGQALDRAQALGHATGATDTLRALPSRLGALLSWPVAWENLTPLERGLLALLLGVAVFLAWPAVRDATLGLVGMGLEMLGGAATRALRLLSPGNRRPETVRHAETLPLFGMVPAAAVGAAPAPGGGEGVPAQAPSPETTGRETAGWPGFRTLRWQRHAPPETEDHPSSVPDDHPTADGSPVTAHPEPEASPDIPTASPRQETEGSPVADVSDRSPSRPASRSAADDDLFAAPDLDIPAEEPSPADTRDKTERAIAWLQAYLQDGPRPAREVYQAAQAVGIADRTLRRALRAAGIQARWDGTLRVWALPTHTPRKEER